MMNHYSVNQIGRKFFLTALGLAMAFLTWAQDQQVSGKVTDGAGTGMPGVSVVVKGTQRGVNTDVDGNFKIAVPSNATLVFSFVGYSPQEAAVAGRSSFNVKLAEEASALNEVVVVGYGEQKKRDITGSVSALKAADFNVGVAPSADQLMQGRAAGVQIIQNNGAPGSATTVRVRGGTSLTAGNDPLYVVDGVPLDNSVTSPGGGASQFDVGIRNNGNSNPLNFLNPNDIASMDILKDASATAIYGARAANGVVLITTKRGAKGAGKVTYDGSYGVSTLRKKLDIINAADWKAYSAANGGGTPGTGDVDIQDAVFRTGITQNHNVGVSGGGDNNSYYVSVGYFGQEGIVKGSDMNRVSARVNLQQRAINNRLVIDFGLTGSRERQKQIPGGEGGNFQGGVFAGMFKWNPTQPLLNPDGSFNQISTSLPNPLALIGLVDDNLTTDRILSNISAEFEITKGLKAKAFIAANSSSGIRNTYYSQQLLNYVAFGGVAYGGKANFSSFQVDYTLNYTKEVAKGHNLSALAGFSYQNFNRQFGASTTRNFLNDVLGPNKLESASDFTVPSTSSRDKKEIQSYFGRVNYDYLGRYLLTATVRSDGASVFGANYKTGIFPSFSAGWRISDENFMKNQQLFSNLKLRVGYGRVGNANIDPYQSLTTVTVDPSKSAILGNEFKLGVGLSRAPNADLRWESTSSLNIGLDFAMLNNRLQGSVEVFDKTTNDLLFNVPIAQPAPFASQLQNIGSLYNRGIEFEIKSTNIDNGKFRWTTSFNFTALKNQVTRIREGAAFIPLASAQGAGASGAPIQITQVGYPIATFVVDPIVGYGPEVGGAATPKYGPKTGIDLIATGESLIGTGLPTMYGGISNDVKFGQFDFSLFLQYQGGNKVFNNTFYEYSRRDNIIKNGYGAVRPLYNDPETRPNTDFLEDGSFLRIGNLSLGYTIPSSVFGKTVSNARIYVSAQNLHVFTKYRGFDPGVSTQLSGSNSLGVDYLAYPLPRNIMVGLSVGF